MGALRVGKCAAYLHAQGHEVSVLSARGIPRPQSLACVIPENQVTRTNWVDVNYLPRLVARLRKSGSSEPDAAQPSAGSAPALGRPQGQAKPAGFFFNLARSYVNLTNFPDASIGWFPFAYFAGRRLIAKSRPDLIFASGPPFTTMLLGHRLSKWSGIPWIAEFRDRWSEDPYGSYYATTASRDRREKKLENFLISQTSGLVTVSEPWAENYRQDHGKPTITIYNGFDPADFGEGCHGAVEESRLKIVYTGRIFPERRDPSPLFEAVSRLERPDEVLMAFYGDDEEKILPLARPHGVDHLIEVHPHVPYDQALAAQSNADILFFMQWNNPKEQGNVPGKLFEYLASRRPILANGLNDGVPASFIRARQAGFFSNDPAAIADQLSRWIAEKREKGHLERLPESVRAGLNRDEQYRKLEDFLGDFLPEQG